VALAVAEQIVDYLLNGVIRNAVNVPSVSANLLERVKPYLTLAERLGAFQAQILQGPPPRWPSNTWGRYPSSTPSP